MRRVTALSSEQPYVTWVLIGINVIVYLISVSRPGGMINSPSWTGATERPLIALSRVARS